MGRLKSDNRHLGILSGYEARWLHIDAGDTAKKTITPRAGEPVVLHRIVLNTNGQAVTVRDSATGVIASLAGDAPEGTFRYNLKLKGNLIVENGGSDLTVVFSND
jgi:hypothetical protein